MSRKGKLDPPRLKAMLADLAAGLPVLTVARKYNVNRNTVRYHADRNGIVPRRGGHTIKPLRDELRSLRGEIRKLRKLVAREESDEQDSEPETD